MSNIKLNEKQYYAFNMIKEGNSIALLGGGGVGKSTIINFFSNIYGKTKNIAMTATTGVSSLIIGGNTIHSYLGIGLASGNVEQIYKSISKKQQLITKWNKIDILVIDEISMMTPELFDKIEELARMIRCNDLPFGGIQLVLCGDFLQLPCVGSENFCFDAKSWNKCIRHVIILDKVMRQTDDLFRRVLNKVRYSIIDEEVIDVLNSRLIKNRKEEYENLFIKPMRFYPTRRIVDSINDCELEELDGNLYMYEMKSEVKKNIPNISTIRDTYIKQSNIPQELYLGENAQVMLTKNLDVKSGLVNGSMGKIIKFVDNFPYVKFLNGIEMIITMDVWNYEVKGDVILKIHQIPLILSYATTIHKCQGITLDMIEVNLAETFEYGQAYVALSRVKTLEGLYIEDIDYDKIKSHPRAIEFYKRYINDEMIENNNSIMRQSISIV